MRRGEEREMRQKDKRIIYLHSFSTFLSYLNDPNKNQNELNNYCFLFFSSSKRTPTSKQVRWTFRSDSLVHVLKKILSVLSSNPFMNKLLFLHRIYVSCDSMPKSFQNHLFECCNSCNCLILNSVHDVVACELIFFLLLYFIIDNTDINIYIYEILLYTTIPSRQIWSILFFYK